MIPLDTSLTDIGNFSRNRGRCNRIPGHQCSPGKGSAAHLVWISWGVKTSGAFAEFVDREVETQSIASLLEKCIHITGKQKRGSAVPSFVSSLSQSGMGAKLGWKDNLQRDFDFILDFLLGRQFHRLDGVFGD